MNYEYQSVLLLDNGKETDSSSFRLGNDLSDRIMKNEKRKTKNEKCKMKDER
jgi:hypothetical protein